MNRPKRSSPYQWSSLQTGRPIACPAIAICPEAGPPAPASAAGYVHRPSPLPATAATLVKSGPEAKESKTPTRQKLPSGNS